MILKLHQILHISNASIAPDLAPCLVFESYNVVKLAHRIKELEQEKGMQKEQKKSVLSRPSTSWLGAFHPNASQYLDVIKEQNYVSYIH